MVGQMMNQNTLCYLESSFQSTNVTQIGNQRNPNSKETYCNLQSGKSNINGTITSEEEKTYSSLHDGKNKIAMMIFCSVYIIKFY